jgi:D-3-phosphoglycerate dehydrogenase
MNTLGCKVLFTSRSIKPDTSWGKFTSIDALLAESDIVTLHTPLTPETEFLIDENKISKMKETAFLINTARGKVVDYNALADALTKGKLAGAAIDVYEMEPPISKNHPLLTAPNCILTPHIAYATNEALTLRAKIASENIINWLGD